MWVEVVTAEIIYLKDRVRTDKLPTSVQEKDITPAETLATLPWEMLLLSGGIVVALLTVLLLMSHQVFYTEAKRIYSVPLDGVIRTSTAGPAQSAQ